MSDDSLLPQGLTGEPALRLRIYIGEADHHASQPLFTAIVHAARQAGLSGATVYKGIEGFGAHSVVHAARIVDMSSDLPIVVELVDTPPKIHSFFVDTLRGMLDDGMVTIDRAYTIYSSAGTARRG